MQKPRLPVLGPISRFRFGDPWGDTYLANWMLSVMIVRYLSNFTINYISRICVWHLSSFTTRSRRSLVHIMVEICGVQLLLTQVKVGDWSQIVKSCLLPNVTFRPNVSDIVGRSPEQYSGECWGLGDDMSKLLFLGVQHDRIVGGPGTSIVVLGLDTMSLSISWVGFFVRCLCNWSQTWC